MKTEILILIIAAWFVIQVALYKLCDTITEYLSEGKKFAPNETKGFK